MSMTFWDGATWVDPGTLTYWDGASWATPGEASVWDGTAWVPCWTGGITASDDNYLGVSGGTGLMNAMFDARELGVPLTVTGTWGLELNAIWIPDGVTVIATGAKFNHTPTARFKNAAAWPATTMPDTCGGYDGGSFTWTGGEFNGGGDGIFTLSHSPGFTISSTVMYNYCTDSNSGHAIEINSSGGPNDLAGSDYRVKILGNFFRGVQSQRSNSNDEPLHYDWAWNGSGCAGAEDHTMCHNLLLSGNSFHRLDESGAWEFGLCAIGGHRMSSDSYGDMGNAGIPNPADGEPAERHNFFLIEDSTIHGAVGSTGTSPNKGAIHLWNVRDVIVRNNNLHGCTPDRLVTGWDADPIDLNGSPANISISGNTHDGAPVTITMPPGNTTGGLATEPANWLDDGDDED